MKSKLKAIRVIAIAIFTLAIFGVSTTASAAKTPNDPIELKYVGQTQSQPVFQLNLNNTEASSYYIHIKDVNGKVIYSEKVQGTGITRNYRFDIKDVDMTSPDFGLTVEVTDAKTKNTQVFHVKSKTQVIQNFEVAKA
ncbi:MAG: hypothetical protein ACTHNG_02925 [Ginsengibacter sp.]|jgi:hypothetical protein|nr:hypothetical protein [Hanamia sp.]